MTRRAARELLNLVIGNQDLAKFDLVGKRRAAHGYGVRLRGLLVVDPEHGVTGADIPLGIAMTVETPRHLQRVLLPHERHAIDLAMAGGAPHALGDVDAVIEVDEVGQIVNAGPVKRPVRVEAGADRLEEWRIREDL